MPWYQTLKDQELRDKENLLWSICQDINKLADLTKDSDEISLYVSRIKDHCLRRLDDKLAEEKLLLDLSEEDRDLRINEMNRI